MTNCVVHGYRRRKRKIELLARYSDDNTVMIRVTDRGCGIADIEQAMEPLYTSAPEEERAGLGFAVMESFMDKVTVKSKVGKGTADTMKRKLISEKETVHK